mgnify:CR=1 FL=1
MARLWDVATTLLSTVAAAFDGTDRPPSVAYVADGQITLDFGAEDALVVTFDRLRPGLAGVGAAGGHIDHATILTGEFSIYVLRWAPVPDDQGNGPTTAEMHVAARIMLDDTLLVATTVLTGFANGTFLGTCGDASFLDSTPVGPQGGFEGSRFRIAATL